MRTCLLLVMLVAACSGKHQREAYAVGATISAGGAFGRNECKYTVRPAAVAKLGPDRMAPVVLEAEGEVVETCGDTKTTYDVVKPTALRVDGPAALDPKASPAHYRLVALAGTRELIAKGVDLRPDWQLGADCAGAVTTEQDLGAGHDFGDPTYDLVVTRTAAGTCTLTGTAIGLHAQKTIAVH